MIEKLLWATAFSAFFLAIIARTYSTRYNTIYDSLILYHFFFFLIYSYNKYKESKTSFLYLFSTNRSSWKKKNQNSSECQTFLNTAARAQAGVQLSFSFFRPGARASFTHGRSCLRARAIRQTQIRTAACIYTHTSGRTRVCERVRAYSCTRQSIS